ncbi:MAG TPA: amidase [Solirubrobacteraceae bacterium]|nr:amidase [Solirubrobacteraceae bacterium]
MSLKDAHDRTPLSEPRPPGTAAGGHDAPAPGTAAGGSDPADLGVLEAAAQLRARRLSCAELTEACLDRIASRNGGEPSFDGAPEAINAWVRVYPEVARAAAAAADARFARDPDPPVLCGIPVGLKDLFAVRGLPVTASSRVLQDAPAPADAPVWSRLAQAGMVLLGHTHAHEFAAGGTTDQVGNPWALDRVAGGSSGGSAAALAARMTPAAVGSDTCGSLRIPSACCGTSAIKPTHGRLPLDGVIPLAPTLDHPGPMARTVADCSALLAGMGHGNPPADPTCPPPAPLGELPLRPRSGSRPLADLTIALTSRTEGLALEAEVAAGFDAARAACEHLGARVVAVPVPKPLDWDDVTRILLTEVWAYHARHVAAAERYRPAIAEFVEAAQGFTDVAAYLEAQRGRASLTAAWEAWFVEHGIDLVLEPTLPIVPYGRGSGYERGHAGGAGDPMIELTALWDMTGMPVAALPVTWQVGVSLIAPRGAETGLIQAAIDLQEHGLGVPEWAPPGRIDAVLDRSEDR